MTMDKVTVMVMAMAMMAVSEGTIDMKTRTPMKERVRNARTGISLSSRKCAL